MRYGLFGIMDRAVENLKQIDPTLNDTSSTGGGEHITVQLNSKLLSNNYPELFALKLSFNKTHLGHKNNKIIVCQYIMIGHLGSKNPGFIPGFIDIGKPQPVFSIGKDEFVSHDNITCQQKTIGLVKKDISKAEQRGILGIDDIMDIAEKTFSLMHPDSLKLNLDYDKTNSEIEERSSGCYNPTFPENIYLKNQLNSNSPFARWSHLRSKNSYIGGVILSRPRVENKGKTEAEIISDFLEYLSKKYDSNPTLGYVGSIILTVPKIGTTSEVQTEIVKNFSNFYSALSKVLTNKGFHNPLNGKD